MLFKCIEQNPNCGHGKRFGECIYCDHKPNHLFKQDGKLIYKTNICADKEGE